MNEASVTANVIGSDAHCVIDAWLLKSDATCTYFCPEQIL